MSLLSLNQPHFESCTEPMYEMDGLTCKSYKNQALHQWIILPLEFMGSLRPCPSMDQNIIQKLRLFFSYFLKLFLNIILIFFKNYFYYFNLVFSTLFAFFSKKKKKDQTYSQCFV